MATASHTVVLGAGIIGVSTAYYLSQHQPGASIHLVDPSPELFSSASGYAGGFLARDWFSPASASLGALSFDEHRRLAEQDGGAEKWGYAPSTSISLAPPDASVDTGMVDIWCREGASRAQAASGADGSGSRQTAPAWLRTAEGEGIEVLSDEGTTAQVDPRQLCEHLLRECLANGVHLHHPARAIALRADARDELASIRIADARSSTETDIPCTSIVIAAGAWSARVFADLFPASSLHIPLSSLAGHSLAVKSPLWSGFGSKTPPSEPVVSGGSVHARSGPGAVGADSCHALFLADEQPGYSPEIFSRANGEIYIAGLNSATEPLPDLPTDAKTRISPAAIAKLAATAGGVVRAAAAAAADIDTTLDDKKMGTASQESKDSGLEIVREGLCFRPVTDRGVPIVSRVEDRFLRLRSDRNDGERTTAATTTTTTTATTRSIKTRARPGEGGVYLATGHGPWGISMALGTGKVVAEMVQGRAKLSANIAGLGLGV